MAEIMEMHHLWNISGSFLSYLRHGSEALRYILSETHGYKIQSDEFIQFSRLQFPRVSSLFAQQCG